MKCVDDDIEVWRAERGGDSSLVLSTSSATVTTNGDGKVKFCVSADGDYQFDDIRVISDSESTTTVLAYNSANELTSTTTDSQMGGKFRGHHT